MLKNSTERPPICCLSFCLFRKRLRDASNTKRTLKHYQSHLKPKQASTLYNGIQITVKSLPKNAAVSGQVFERHG